MLTMTGRRASASSSADRIAALAVLAAMVAALSWWIRTLALPAGIVAAVAAGSGAAFAWRLQRRRSAITMVVVAAAIAVIVTMYDRGLVVRLTGSDVVANGPADAETAALAGELAAAIRETQQELEAVADAAVSGAPAAAALTGRSAEVGLVVYGGGRPVDWGGPVVIGTDPLWERGGIVATPFFVVQYATAVRDPRRAVATAVVLARPPADKLHGSLASRFGTERRVSFDVRVNAAANPGDSTAHVGGSRLSIVARTPAIELVAAARDEHARSRGAAVLAFAILVSLGVLWRPGDRWPERLISLGLPALAIAITPLNALSNVSRLFDASTYFAPIGGPFTSSVGALALSSALALFAVLAMLRARARPRQRWAASFAVLAIAGAAPFLLRDLARGVNLPPNGASTGLWIAWELALFLAATSFLTAGVTAGQWTLGRSRGLPLWIAPAIAAGAALLGPVLITGGARWPQWYALLWIAAVAALALARRSRAILFPSAIVAACGATTLLWGVTLRERVELATADVVGIADVDASAAALLERFANQLAIPPEPSTSELLLARYAAADLAAIGAPITLAYWPANGAPRLLPLGGEARLLELPPLVAEARGTGKSVLRPLPSAPASALGLAVPYESGAVVTVVVGARSLLSRAPSYAALLGLAGEGNQPPYQLAITGQALPSDPDRTDWIRRGEHLHADWALEVPDGRRIRVHASVAFDGYDALVPRGMLIVLLSVLVVVLLWIVDLLADGALTRWMRGRRTQFLRSYRLRLTLALFAFFVVPALAFALWSYRRLQADDRASRELLVRETLRRASVADADSAPRLVGIPAEVPLLVYRSGQLVDASDSLLITLAPAGRFLDPGVRRALDAREELVATTALNVGGRPTLFGYRSLASSLVASVPARRDDIGLDKRRSDLGVLVLLATVLGGVAALGLSGVAARQLARPIGTLRRGALAVAGGSRAPLNVADAPAEFVPVFSAFDRMARELAASEAQLTRAERVFAWGEMARQVAHEIKNPLTPIRLGVQHLLRAWRDHRPDYGEILEENAARLLREIDHLDATARSFSQYGMAPDARAAVVGVDIAAVVRDVAALESLGADGLDWRAQGVQQPYWANARTDELREVLLNLCENSRLAGARRVELRVGIDEGRVVVSVSDDGEGMSEDVRARVFEPHFSTRTSGSGLGLAISRRLVEGWGGSIDLNSAPGQGTTVQLRLLPARSPT